jgi:hypothetical protein
MVEIPQKILLEQSTADFSARVLNGGNSNIEEISLEHSTADFSTRVLNGGTSAIVKISLEQSISRIPLAY